MDAETFGIATHANVGHVRLSSSATNQTETTNRSTGAVAYSYTGTSTGTINLNEYRQAGEWAFHNITTATNFPGTAANWQGATNGAYLKVLRYQSDTAGTQILRRRGSDEVWTRRYTAAATFTAWVRMDTAATMAARTVKGNNTAAVNSPTDLTAANLMELIASGQTTANNTSYTLRRGANATTWTVEALPASGTVTSIATGTGLTGGTITGSGTIAMANMASRTVKGNNSASSAAPADLTAANLMELIASGQTTANNTSYTIRRGASATAWTVTALPDIPAAASNGVLTIQRNGTQVATFSANQSTNQTVNITVPTTAADVNARANTWVPTPSDITGTFNSVTTAASLDSSVQSRNLVNHINHLYGNIVTLRAQIAALETSLGTNLANVWTKTDMTLMTESQAATATIPNGQVVLIREN